MSDDPLDQINRFALVVLALLVMFGALLLILLAWGAPDGSIDKLVDFAGYLRDHDSREGKAIVTLGAAVVVLAMLTVLVTELTPSPTQRMRVRNITSGDAAITTTEIARRVNAEVQQVPHVARCESTIAARGKRIEVVLDLHVDEGADLTRTADEACRRAHVLVEQQLGLELAARPRARLHYRELRLRKDEQPPPRGPSTGWERPADTHTTQTPPREPDEGDRDQSGRAGTSEEAQA